jgi:urease accessory protein
VAAGLVTDTASLSAFIEARLRAAGLVTAGLAAAATFATPRDVGRLDAECDARLPSPALRDASRAQGRGLLRTVRAAWAAPGTDLAWSDLGPRPHHPVVLGSAARAAGLDAAAAALVAAHLAISGPATAAQRLLALDPVQVAALTADLAAVVDEVAAHAVADPAALRPDGWAALPDASDPMLDLLAEIHATRDDRLFTS